MIYKAECPICKNINEYDRDRQHLVRYCVHLIATKPIYDGPTMVSSTEEFWFQDTIVDRALIKVQVKGEEKRFTDEGGK